MMVLFPATAGGRNEFVRRRGHLTVTVAATALACLATVLAFFALTTSSGCAFGAVTMWLTAGITLLFEYSSFVINAPPFTQYEWLHTICGLKEGDKPLWQRGIAYFVISLPLWLVSIFAHCTLAYTTSSLYSVLTVLCIVLHLMSIYIPCGEQVDGTHEGEVNPNYDQQTISSVSVTVVQVEPVVDVDHPSTPPPKY